MRGHRTHGVSLLLRTALRIPQTLRRWQSVLTPQRGDPSFCSRRTVLFPVGYRLLRRGGRVAPKHPLQPCVKARRNRLLLILGRPVGLDGCSSARLHARMPKLDVQAVDLLDEHENRATDSCGLLTSGLPKLLAPAPKRLEFLFVQAHSAHRDR